MAVVSSSGDVMNIDYRFDLVPPVNAVIELYRNAGLPRPITDPARIALMYQNANLIVTAWDADLLVGVARSLSDFCWCCYLADLAVRQEYQGHRIGQRMIDLTKEKVGEQSMLLLLSVPAAMGYYPKVGLQPVDNGFIIHRES